MSIKGYLFVLFGALILILGGSQLLVSHFYKAQLQSELGERSRDLSQNLVKVLIDNVGTEQEFVVQFDEQVLQESLQDAEALRQEFEQDIESVSQAIAQLSEEVVRMEMETDDASAEQKAFFRAKLAAKQQELRDHLNAMMSYEKELKQRQRASIAEAKREAADEYRRRLHDAVSQIEIDTNSWLDKGNVAIIDAPISPTAPEKGKVALEFAHDINLPNQETNEQLERFSESMIGAILMSSLAGLLLVYMLSHVISAPLSALAKGHKKLGQGELGYQVDERGVKELKSILNGFNKMSRQLASLSEQKKQMAQQKQLAELGEVTRGIAHSLRNPLHTLGLLSEAVAQSESIEDANKLLSQMQQKIAMMDKSIQSLLTLSSTQVNRQLWVPLAATVQDILLELSINGSKPSIAFHCEDQGIQVQGAESEIRSILHAVVINAVEATPDTGRIDLTLAENDESYTLVVADTGKGISPEVRDKLAQPHVTTKAEGTGMGIYIAERLIQGHYGGRITFADNPGGGTLVTLYFAKPDSNKTQQEDKPQTEEV
ncbi:sensor histidine kinase [Shewanella spartinae]|uniref:sensor histidine kinase n=1 Tax=Shewanella spartinae TaxID=2864205 RepID=UPI001C6557AC|nr:HAMP domain-containing sensor histidine kinase [Shewanella spartinae]QYJ92404.1 two-component sensor histidine kinase [Shewanella spartinae]